MKLKALVGAFSVIVKTNCETDGSSAALVWHHQDWGRVMGGELIIRQITAERNHNLSANLIKNHFIMAR